MTRNGKAMPTGSRKARYIVSVSNVPAPEEILSADEPLLTIPEVADRLGVLVTRVHALLREQQLLEVRVDGVRKVPARLLNDDGTINRFVPGVIALLSDGGFQDWEILQYLFTPDESLPGRPVDALHGHLAREVMRRAQAMAL